MKNAYRIGGALVVGICIVLGAFYMAPADDQTANVIGATTETRGAIPVTDGNNNKIPDWKEGLEAIAFDRITVSTNSTSSTKSPEEPYVPPTTLTGKFSEAFLEDYLNGKINGAEYTDPTTFVQSAVTAIKSNAASRTYTTREVSTVPTSPEALRLYGNQIGAIIARHSLNNEHEIVILNRAIASENEADLKPLEPIRTAYRNIIMDTLALPVPDKIRDQHIALLNAYEGIALDVEAMQKTFSDPLFSLARVQEHETHSGALYLAFNEIASVLQLQGISYGNEDTGRFFNLFEQI